MKITKVNIVNKLVAYLNHEITLDQLVEWSECALMDGDFEDADVTVLSRVVARLGVADVRAFGLTWEDCEDLLRQLGFVSRVEVVAA